MSHDGPPLYRCVRCGCPATDHATDDEERRECTRCECEQYECVVAAPPTDPLTGFERLVRDIGPLDVTVLATAPPPRPTPAEAWRALTTEQRDWVRSVLHQERAWQRCHYPDNTSIAALGIALALLEEP